MKAVGAVAASMQTAAYHMIKSGTFYQDLGADHFKRRTKPAQANRLVARLQSLGYDVGSGDQAADRMTRGSVRSASSASRISDDWHTHCGCGARHGFGAWPASSGKDREVLWPLVVARALPVAGYSGRSSRTAPESCANGLTRYARASPTGGSST